MGLSKWKEFVQTLSRKKEEIADSEPIKKVRRKIVIGKPDSNSNSISKKDNVVPKDVNLEEESKGKNTIDQTIKHQNTTPKFIYRNTKLTIFLLENTKEVADEKENLEKIITSLATTGYVCVINYGSSVRVGKAVEAKSFKLEDLLYKKDIGDKACIYDALVALESVVEKSSKSEELKEKHIRIDNIDIIGIGRCVDNCSTTSIETAIESFCRVVNLTNVVTKYFCLSEENFKEAATIGFHSIGAINRNYM